MKNFYRQSVVAGLVVSLVLSFTGPTAALAATAPSLGDAESFSALAALSASSANTTTLSGDVGLSTGVSSSFTGPWVVGGTGYFGPLTLAFDARADALAAFDDLASQASDGTWSLNPAPVPGVWTAAGSAVFPGPTLTLTGGPTDVWVFQIGADFTFDGDVILLGGALACNVFWQVGNDATIAAGSDFVGTLIAGNDITVVSGATVNGRVLSLDGDLTVDANAISGPSCTPATPTPAPPGGGGGGGGGSFLPPQVPPLIEVVKVPFPLALPGGPGPVTYIYTVRNIGPVAMTSVTAVDDWCSPLVFVSGDTNDNQTLEVSETWSYTCSTTLSATRTNTVTVTGRANGITATDTAAATVTVGGPVPPLIHVTKVPNPFVLPLGGGGVTYTERITNPGTVALSNVTLVDNRCSPMVFISGDTDGDSQLDTTEVWTYTCRTNLTRTTTNTAIATGEANGITVTDFAIATVVLGAPALPSAGLPPDGASIVWSIVALGLVMVATSLIVGLRKRTN